MTEKREINQLPTEILPIPPDAMMRRRSLSDATQYKGTRRTSCLLPEIKVEDCSEKKVQSDDEELDELPPLGAFRPRANTCPNDLFHHRRPRPPTPPPSEGKKLTWKELTRNPSKEKVMFSPHKLSKVSEVSEGIKGETDKNQNTDKSVNYTTRKLQQTSLTDGATATARSAGVARTIGVTECG
ncbi:hypothetical protein FSP39_002219 [Pinctada imbricata]|uniref:Uncharacterized protein n=1 Tax=Pinctada imbricata TaxID=66713 RepID=A0AA88XYL3_PINIB|nr:hypothetical protein FSP39_002219 [Pinctada imbricata]